MQTENCVTPQKVYINLLEEYKLATKKQIGNVNARLIIGKPKKRPLLVGWFQLKNSDKRFWLNFEYDDKKWKFLQTTEETQNGGE